MRKTTWTILIGSLLALPAFADTGKDMSAGDAAVSKDKMAKSETVPEGFVIVEDFVTVDLKQLPIDLLRTAETDFAGKNFGEAAADLRAAGRVLRLEAKQAQGDNQHLTNAAEDLDKLAADVKTEAIKGSDMFHSRVARVLYHDAAHHRLQAQREWDRKQYRSAGDDLAASANAAEIASRWAGKDLASTNRGAIEKAHTVASELSANSGWAAADVRDALSGLEGAMGRIASQVMPSSDKSRAGETPSGL